MHSSQGPKTRLALPWGSVSSPDTPSITVTLFRDQTLSIHLSLGSDYQGEEQGKKGLPYLGWGENIRLPSYPSRGTTLGEVPSVTAHFWGAQAHAHREIHRHHILFIHTPASPGHLGAGLMARLTHRHKQHTPSGHRNIGSPGSLGTASKAPWADRANRPQSDLPHPRGSVFLGSKPCAGPLPHAWVLHRAVPRTPRCQSVVRSGWGTSGDSGGV